jgi:hypothetical protein
MPVSRPGRPARSTDFCPQLITFTTEEDGQEQVAPCRSPLTVVADGADVIESVCRAGHRYATSACEQLDCTGWKAITLGRTTQGYSRDQLGQLKSALTARWIRGPTAPGACIPGSAS